MTGTMWKKLLAVALIFAAAGAATGTNSRSRGQEPVKLKGRLPPYFADIVNEEQRQRIYAIQATYAKTRDSLEAQLEALKVREMRDIESVLSPPQRSMLEKSRSDAAAKRQQSAAYKKAAELGLPAAGLVPGAMPVKGVGTAKKPSLPSKAK